MSNRDANFLTFTRSLQRAWPAMSEDTARLEVLEAEARKIWPSGAERGSLFVLRHDDGFFYQWGNAWISRNEAARRVNEMEAA